MTHSTKSSTTTEPHGDVALAEACAWSRTEAALILDPQRSEAVQVQQLTCDRRWCECPGSFPSLVTQLVAQRFVSDERAHGRWSGGGVT